MISGGGALRSALSFAPALAFRPNGACQLHAVQLAVSI